MPTPSFVADLGLATAEGFGYSFTLSTTVPAGDLLLLVSSSADGGNATDTKGNLYALAAAGQVYSRLTTALVAGDKITKIGVFAFRVYQFHDAGAVNNPGATNGAAPTTLTRLSSDPPVASFLYFATAEIDNGAPFPTVTFVPPPTWTVVGSFQPRSTIEVHFAYLPTTPTAQFELEVDFAGGHGNALQIRLNSITYLASPNPPPTGDTGSSPWNLHTFSGQYQIAYAHAAGIRYRRADHSIPPFAFAAVAVTTTAGDDEPAAAELLAERLRVRLVFHRAGVIYRTDSDDDGETWGDPVTLFAAGSHPTLAYDPQSLCTLYACYNGGALKGRLQEPGDSTPGSEYTLDIPDIPADDSFHLSAALDGSRRWLLVMKTSGGAIKNYLSTDEGVTFAEVS